MVFRSWLRGVCNPPHESGYLNIYVHCGNSSLWNLLSSPARSLITMARKFHSIQETSIAGPLLYYCGMAVHSASDCPLCICKTCGAQGHEPPSAPPQKITFEMWAVIAVLMSSRQQLSLTGTSSYSPASADFAWPWMRWADAACSPRKLIALLALSR